jgi:hypothetical protein
MPYILTGEQIGSYFGHTMTAGDLNGDGYTDLVISAPFYYSKKLSQGGAVYIYYGLNGKVKEKNFYLKKNINSIMFSFQMIDAKYYSDHQCIHVSGFLLFVYLI